MICQTVNRLQRTSGPLLATNHDKLESVHCRSKYSGNRFLHGTAARHWCDFANQSAGRKRSLSCVVPPSLHQTQVMSVAASTAASSSGGCPAASLPVHYGSQVPALFAETAAPLTLLLPSVTASLLRSHHNTSSPAMLPSEQPAQARNRDRSLEDQCCSQTSFAAHLSHDEYQSVSVSRIDTAPEDPPPGRRCWADFLLHNGPISESHGRHLSLSAT